MDVDWKSLAKDKRAWIGVGGAAGLGAVVYFRRKKAAGAAPAGTTTSGSTGGTSNGAATLDTTGYDLASFLGNYSQSLQDQLTAGLNAIKGANGNGTTTPLPGASGGGPIKIGSWNKQPDATYKVRVQGGTDWANLQSSLAGFGLNGDIQTLLNLNPGLMSDVKNSKGANGIWSNTFINPIDVNVPLMPGYTG